MTRYAELAVATNFSFLRGASHPEELVAQAIALGMAGLGIADRNSVAGVVRAHVFLRENREQAPDFRLVSGARLVFCDGTPDMLVYPQDRAAWSRLTRLLTRGNLRAEKGKCILRFDDLLDHAEGQRIAVMAQSTFDDEEDTPESSPQVPFTDMLDAFPCASPRPTEWGEGEGEGRCGAHRIDHPSRGETPHPNPLPASGARGRQAAGLAVEHPSLHASRSPRPTEWGEGEGRWGAHRIDHPSRGETPHPNPLPASGARGRQAAGLAVEHPSLHASRSPRPTEWGEGEGEGRCGAHRIDHPSRGETPHPNPLPASGARGRQAAGLDNRLRLLARLAPGRVWIAATVGYGRHMRRDLAARATLARGHGLPVLAVNDVVMHGPQRRALADVVTCIRTGVTIEDAGLRLHVNAERHLKPPGEMARIFDETPDAIAQTMRFLDGIAFSLDDLRYEYPDELREGFASEQEALEAFARQGAQQRYPDGVPEHVDKAIRHELQLIGELGYAAYFLTVHDIVRFARSRRILCQGRGSAANSTVCFCLGITEVDPTKHDLLFERFVSAERREPPDIDVDFEHERREEVMQYIYARYGRERAGLTATVISYRARSSTREVAKVFGYDEAQLSALVGTIAGWWSGEVDRDELCKIGFDPQDHRLALTLDMARELAGFPRHLSQHTGGFVITRSRLDEVVPIAHASMQDRTTIEWDKDDLDALGILKIDVLALGMLSCLRRGYDLLAQHYDRPLTLSSTPAEDAAVYRMIQRADTIGVFQIESRAQMSMLPRLRPAAFYDLVIEVAIVRPGPIQGDMVHPYLRRRQNLEKVSYPSPELEAVLGKTLGVPLFQEQAMKIAIVAAGFSPGEADRLRRAMATFKRVGTIHTFHAKMVEGMAERGYDRDFAERCFKQIEGFGTYGFPESHAASFALLVYASAWMKCRYPDVFACALLNSQPMGFYAPSQIVRDAREHGVEVREIDINESFWDCTLEDGWTADLRSAAPSRPEPHADREVRGPVHPRHAEQTPDIQGTRAIRLGFREIKGVREEDMRRLADLRGRGYDSVRDLWLRTGLTPAVLERLAAADAFRSIGLDRRDALWAVRGLNRSGDKDDLPLFARVGGRESEPDANLPPMPPGEQVVEDYRHMSMSLKAHPVSFLRARLTARRILRSEELALIAAPVRAAPGARQVRHPWVTVAGLVLVRQRPGSAKGVIFMTLEDETGVANAIVWPKVFERERAKVLGGRFVAITGWLQNEAGVIHVVAEQVDDLTPMLALLSSEGSRISTLANADEFKHPQDRDKVDDKARRLALAEAAGVMPKGRNFH